ncbi:hypothetical protein ASPBRDRAFT_192777 [Aspergillus brasiliensis CBS 101740]|uniref:Uncharacterized protein n=1 Tax=Aspergillus brasiliensis (strain CBS 101740 / IMI 381727 / IBT 21946) TaxID=767769 RepID=A0A1L9UYC7_ASPBC|nr:hypothetical protein ASPBRDRAFT_192777 [Aspergillus brasiliensis CBS 101740]
MALVSGASGLSLADHLSSPPKASLQILGTHVANKENNVIDFDLWVDCSKASGINSVKILTDGGEDCRSWSYSADHDTGDPQAILPAWLYDWLNDGNTDDRIWTLRKSGHFSEEDCTALKTHIERLARKTAYGGSLEVLFHAPSIDIEAGSNASPEKTHIAQLKADWMFECPFTPTDLVWSERIMNAMVDHKNGWIKPPVLKPSYGMSPFRRAMRANDTSHIVSREQDANGVTRSVTQFSSWGHDSSA